MKTVCETRSQASITMDVVRLEADTNSLDRHECDGHVGLEQDLRHGFAMGLGVQKNIREQDIGFLGATPDFRKGSVYDKMSRESITKAIVRLESGQRYNSQDRHETCGHVERLERGAEHPTAGFCSVSKSSHHKKKQKEHNLP